MHIMQNLLKANSFMQSFLDMLLMHILQNLVRILCRTYAELMQNLSGTFGVLPRNVWNVYAKLMPASPTCARLLRTNGALFILAAVCLSAVRW